MVRLLRRYEARGTNGEIRLLDELICYSIELPWEGNKRGISCIPEGRYELRRRFSKRFRWHLEVCGVEGRSFILIHSANYAIRDLRGCIAPVSKLTGVGRGIGSRGAFSRLRELVFGWIDEGSIVYLEILKA